MSIKSLFFATLSSSIYPDPLTSWHTKEEEEEAENGEVSHGTTHESKERDKRAEEEERSMAK